MGKHTQQFCRRVAKRSSDEIQKKILFIAIAGADEFVARQLGGAVEKTKGAEPVIGGCAYSDRRVTGSYLPTIGIGAPVDMDRYRVAIVDGIKVYFPKNMRTKSDSAHIAVKLRKILFFKWLEVDGAKSFAVYD